MSANPGVPQTVPAAPRAGLTPPPVWVTTLIFAALHLALAAQLWLVQDEAYYALWATHLSPAYYDHPPMIALWIRMGEAFLGQGALAVRLVPVLGFALVTPITAAIARAAGGDARTARWAALMFNCMSVPFVLGFTATPDAPSTLFWALATLAVLRAPGAPGRHWLLAGLWMALGVLSKLTNLFLGVAVTLWLMASPAGRQELRRPATWAAMALAAVLLAPFLWWSATHGWLGLARQFGRLDQPGPTHNGTLRFVTMAILTGTPLLMWRALAASWREGGAARRLLWFSAPLWLYLLVHSLGHAIQANWIVPLFPGLAVLAALGGGARHPGRALATGSALGLSALALILALWPGKPIFRGDNPPNQTKGWPALTAQIHGLMAQDGATWIATVDYGTTGAFAFALPGVPVWALTEPQRWGFRGGFPRALCDRPALLIQPRPEPHPPQSLFTEVGPTRVLERKSGGATLESYAATEVRGLKGGPCAKD